MFKIFYYRFIIIDFFSKDDKLLKTKSGDQLIFFNVFNKLDLIDFIWLCLVLVCFRFMSIKQTGIKQFNHNFLGNIYYNFTHINLYWNTGIMDAFDVVLEVMEFNSSGWSCSITTLFLWNLIPTTSKLNRNKCSWSGGVKQFRKTV